MKPDYSRHLPLGGTFNIRDLGGYSTGDGGSTRWRTLLRSDALHSLDEAGRMHLVGAGLRTVIDLRFADEINRGPSPFGGEVATIAVPLFADLKSLQAEPPAGPPDEDALVRLYQAALADCGHAFRTAIEAIVDADDGMVIFHCTAGKDRTGLLAALILVAAGVDTPTIAEDYALTAAFAGPMLEKLEAEMMARGEDPARIRRFSASRAETMHATLDHLERQYGGAASYLAAHGLGEGLIDRLRARLVEA